MSGYAAFLPYLLESDEGHVVNTSSVLGFFAVPAAGTYTAAKFAVRGFTECLRQEMLASGRNVKVSCVHPGMIRTATSSESAARTILRGSAKGKARILVGPDARAVDHAIRLLGPHYQRSLAWAAARGLPQLFPRAADVRARGEN